MRSLKFIYVVLVLIFSGLSYSDNNSINGTCPGEIIEEIDGATTNATHTENGNIGGGGNDRYRMTFPVSGTLDISSANTNPARNANYRFYISRNSCGNNDSDWNIENSYTGTSPSFSVPVNAGDTIYIRFKTISGQANNNRHAYALSLNFTANTDTITSFTAPSQVTIGETITVTVDYEVSEDREIVTGFQQNHAPWDGWDWTSVIVSTGTGTVNLTFTVPNSIPLGNAYQIPIVLQPVGGGWLTRLDDKVENPVNVVASVPPNTCNASHGLIGNYYNNNSYTAPIALSRVDSNIDFAWGGGSPDGSINSDNFSVEWTGTIYIPEDADYTFSLAHDDVFELIIDGNTIYNNGTWTGGSSTFIDATPVHLTPGIHPIAVRLIEQSGGAYARLAWRNNAGINSQTIVPNINFCTTGMPLVATDDQYNTSSGLTLTGNFMTDDTGNGVDSGLNIQASTSPSTAPTKGTLTINTNGSFTYVPELNATGSDFFDYTITDIQGNSTTATVVINLPIASPSTMGAFQQRYINNLKGNIRIIGNTVLQSPTPTSTLANHRQNLFYVDIDGDGSTFNSSSADINATESGVDVTGARIVWAALYWQGYLHNDDLDTGADTQFNTFNTNSPNINISETRILNSIQNQSILFKVGNGSYTAISPHALGIDRQYFGTNTDPNYVSYKYGAFAEVTSLLQNSPPNATYTVANIPTRSGQASSSTYDSLGNYGAWALVVVYDNTQNADEKTRNVSIYDGYVVLSAANNPNQTISVSGFKTPKIAPNGVDSTLSIFAAEGDRYILGDFAQITNQDGTTFNLPDTSGAGSYFASIIEGVPDRNPVILNNNGIDIHTTQVGTVPGGVGAIQTNHISASITLGTTQDTFMPSLISFATELYVPEICYDYTIQQDGFDITDSGDDAREFSTTGAGEVSISIAIKSKEGDFDFENSKLNFELL
ncbi:MAG: cadherin-like domain-containing protein, partial [Sulfurovum sp.]|nr:cadherin-like domain-containing protein [Sulfurovum sp.]